MTTLTGKIVSVDTNPVGSTITAAVPVDGTVLPVSLIFDFAGSEGALVSVAGQERTVTFVDFVASAVTVEPPLTTAVAAQEFLYTVPFAYERVAQVLLSDDEGSGGAIPARIPQALWDRVPEGLRDAGTEESVIIDDNDSGGTWTIADVPGVDPLVSTTRLRVGGLTADGDVLLNGAAATRNIFTLAAGITPPNEAPQLSQTWNLRTTGLDVVTFGDIHYGLCPRIDSGGVASTTELVTALYYFGGDVRVVNKTTGAVGATFVVTSWGPDFAPFGGITSVGANYFVLGQDATRAGAWYIYKLDHNFVKVAEVLWTSAASLPKRPAIGRNDAGQIIVAYTSTGGILRVRRWSVGLADVNDPASGVPNSNDYDPPTGSPATHNIGGVSETVADIGVSRVYVHTTDLKKTFCYNTFGVYAAGHFNSAGSTLIKGACFDGAGATGRFRHLDSNGIIWTYSSFSAPITLTAVTTFVDNDTSSGSLAHETAPSPPASTVVSTRAWLRVVAQAAPDVANTDPLVRDKANLVGIYVNRPPSFTTPLLQVVPSVGNRSVEFDIINTGGAVAPAIPLDFSGVGSPGSIVAASGGFSIDGNSNGGVGTGTFRDSVRAQVASVGSAWTALAVTSPYTVVVGFEPQYRIDAAGTVHLRGRVTKNAAANGAPCATMPVGARPSMEWRWVVDCEPATTSSARLLVEASGAVRPYLKTGTPTLFYLDGVFPTA